MRRNQEAIDNLSGQIDFIVWADANDTKNEFHTALAALAQSVAFVVRGQHDQISEGGRKLALAFFEMCLDYEMANLVIEAPANANHKAA